MTNSLVSGATVEGGAVAPDGGIEIAVPALFHRGDLPTRDKRRAPGARVRVSCFAGRVAAQASRLTGLGSGGVIGGRVALTLAPRAARQLAAFRDVVIVSGTNGKTTTTSLLAAALGAAGPVASNSNGANTPPGFVSALADGRTSVVLEVDEGWVPWAVDQLAPSTAVLLNLSRDQLSRHHEVGHLATVWHEALVGVETVVANADDPAVTCAALAAQRQVWVAAGQRWTDDSLACPRCGQLCHRDDGTWSCSCGLRRPVPDWWLEGDDLVSREHRLPLTLALPGAHNRANAAMAVAAAVTRGVDPAAAASAMHGIDSIDGRYGRHRLGPHDVRLLLAKNPAGWLEIVDLVRAGDHPLVLAFNSDGVDGRDPSWLYDVSFRAMAGRTIVVIGRRATDMLVRLELDGLTPAGVAGGLREALDSIPPGRVDVLANYTAFQDIRRELARAS
ncbi:MAG: MurT ligase domain-containing protein [Nocardioidaceae bacterium]